MRAALASALLLALTGCGIAEHRERHDACIRGGGDVKEFSSHGFVCLERGEVVDEW